MTLPWYDFFENAFFYVYVDCSNTWYVQTRWRPIWKINRPVAWRDKYWVVFLYCMLRLHDIIVSPREYSLVASLCSSLCSSHCCGCTVVLHMGGSSCCLVATLLRCCSVQCGFSGRIDDAKRQSMTSVGEVTAEEGREKFLCTQPKSNRQPLAYETRMVPQDHCQCVNF
jgi:hypothetical protein